VQSGALGFEVPADERQINAESTVLKRGGVILQCLGLRPVPIIRLLGWRRAEPRVMQAEGHVSGTYKTNQTISPERGGMSPRRETILREQLPL